MLDVYHGNGSIQWEQVKQAGHRAVYIKLTEGHKFLDPNAGVYTHGALSAGFLVGFYHFWRLDSPVKEQVQHFLSALYQLHWNPNTFLPPALDFEDPAANKYYAGMVRARLHAFLHDVDTHIGLHPVIYGSRDYLATYLGNGYGGHPLWIAHYTPQESPEPLPEGWGTWAIWQYDPNGNVPGVENPPVDLNRINPAHPLWTAYLKPPKPCS